MPYRDDSETPGPPFSDKAALKSGFVVSAVHRRRPLGMRSIVRPRVRRIVQFKQPELGKVSHREASQSLAVAAFCKRKG
jgi:hypothetical protein